MLPHLAPVIAVIPALIVRTDRGLVSELRGKNALSADRAIPLKGSPLRRLRIRRLSSAGALVAAGADRYFLSEEGWRRYRASRRRAAMITITVSVTLILLGFWLLPKA